MSRRTAALLVLAGLVVVPVGAAAADEPERSGWWNRLSAGDLAAPVPTTQPGDLRVASGGDAPSAYAAVLLRAEGATAATLALAVRTGSTVGTLDVVACPTVDEDWPEGDDQPYDRAPAYDCDRARTFGTLSPDGTALSFALDDLSQASPGTWSLALVPQPGSSTGPFAVDLEEPGPQSFTPETSGGAFEPVVSGDGSVTGAPPPADDDGGTGAAGAPLLPGTVDTPVDVPDLGSAEAPLLAGGLDATAAAPDAPAPAVAEDAGPLAAAPPVTFRPALAAQDARTGSRLLALLVLVGGSAAVGYAAGQQRTGPRLIGGRAASAVPAALPVQETGSVPDRRPRGIGRFAKERDAAPRRLR